MWNKITVTALSAGMLLAAQLANADPRERGRGYDDRGAAYAYGDPRGDGYARGYGESRTSDYDYARVLSSEPITRRVRVTEPRRECYEETRYDDRRDYRDSRDGSPRPAAGSMILGGIIGAAIGNQFGRGDGRRAATAAGALIGAAIGHDKAERGSGSYSNYGSRDSYYDRPTTVQHCDVRYDETWEERVEAYLVTYEYNGRRYTTRLSYDPGPQLRVNVAVRPDGR